MANKRVKAELEMDKNVEIIAMINSILRNNKPVQTEAIMIQAKDKGFNENEVIEVIERLEKQNIIFSPKEGYLQRK